MSMSNGLVYYEIGVPILGMSTVRLGKSQCVAREQDRLGKGPRGRQTGCQYGENPDGIPLAGNRIQLCKWRKWDEVTEIGQGRVWDGGREDAGCVGITDQIQGNTKNLSCSVLPCRVWNGTQGSGVLLFCCCLQM